MEGFVVEDFVPNTYVCIYSGVVLKREGYYLDRALNMAKNDTNISAELYPHGWKNKTTNVTRYISEEIGDLWYYCALTGYEWYEQGDIYV